MDVSIDTRLLKTFIEVAETGAVGRAADRLARTQAAVSLQLQRIEKDLDTQLLERSSRGVSLTEAGQSFLAYARKMVALTEDMQRSMSDRRLSGSLRIGLFEDLAVTRLPLAIAEFRRKHPFAQIELTSSYSQELARSLKEGQNDLVIADPSRFSSAPESFIRRKLVWAASRLMEPEERSSLPVILFDTSCSWQDRMLALLAEKGTAWHVGCRVRSLPAMLCALRAGSGFCILFPEAVPSDCEIVDGQHNLPEAPTAEFGVFVGDAPSPLAHEFASFLEGGF